MTSIDPQLLLAQTTWLSRLARHLVGDGQLVDDVVQDTLVSALERPPRGAHNEARLRRWLDVVLRNVVRQRHRGEWRRNARERAGARPERVGSAEEAAAKVDTQRKLLEAVDSLDPADRQLIVLRYFEELPPRVIARQLDCSSSAVRNRLSRALAVLRARMGARGGDRRPLALALLPLLQDRRATPWSGTWNTVLDALPKPALVLAATGVFAVSWWAWNELSPGAELPGAAPRRTEVSTAPAGVLGETGRGAAGRDGRRTVVPAAAVEDQSTGSGSEPTEPNLIVIARCVDGNRRPIEGATLVAKHVVGRPGAATDATGVARLELVWPAPLTEGSSDSIVVEASAPGWTRVTRQQRVHGEGRITVTFGDVVLGPGGSLTGLVRDEVGRPLERAFVGLVQAATVSTPEVEERRRVLGEGFTGLAKGWYELAETDEKGRYRFDGVPVGSVSATAVWPGLSIGYSRPFEVTAGRVVEAPALVLRSVPPENQIRGVVRDASGRPMTDVDVSVFSNRGPRDVSPQTTSRTGGPEGEFMAVVLSGQKYTLQFERTGATPEGDRTSRYLVRHDVAAGARGLDVVFPPERVLEVAAVGPQRKPVPATFTAFDESNQGLRLGSRLLADSRVEYFVPAQPFGLLVQARGYRSERIGPFDPDALSLPIEVELERSGTVRGLVRAEGRAAAGATVHLHRLHARPAFYTFCPRPGEELYTALRAALRGSEATTGEAGQFELFVQDAGRYVVHAELDGWGRAESVELDLAAGQSIQGIELSLPRPAGMQGRVLASEPGRAAGVVVGATRGRGHVEVQVTDTDGRFRFSGLAPGAWQVRTSTSGSMRDLRNARTWPRDDVDALPVDLVLRPGKIANHDLELVEEASAVLHGQLSIGSLPVEGWYVWARGVTAITDTAGRFEIRTTVGPAIVRFTRRLPNGGELRVRRLHQLVTGETATQVSIQTGGLELRRLQDSEPVTDPRTPHGYALVWKDQAPGSLHYLFDPDPQGGHRVDALPEGAVELRRRSGGSGDPEGWQLVADLEIVAGRLRRFDVPRD